MKLDFSQLKFIDVFARANKLIILLLAFDYNIKQFKRKPIRKYQFQTLCKSYIQSVVGATEGYIYPGFRMRIFVFVLAILLFSPLGKYHDKDDDFIRIVKSPVFSCAKQNIFG